MKAIIRPGLTGRTLKAHVNRAMESVLPNLSAMSTVDVDLRPVHPALGVVKVYLRRLGAVVTQMLSDPSRVGPDCEHLDLQGALRGALSGSRFMAQLRGDVVRRHGDNADLLAVSFFSDSAVVDASLRHALTPVSVFIAQLSAPVSMSKSGSELIG